MQMEDVPYLPRGVRRHYDKVRNMPVLLGPERVIMLDQIGCAVLDELDGKSTVEQISDRLATKYNAPRADIARDVTEYLSELANKRLLETRHG